MPAGYWPLWSSRRKLPRPPWYVAGGRLPFATRKDGDGQNYDQSAGVVAAMSRRGLVGTAGGCVVRRRPENSGGASGGAGREREGRSVGSGGTASVPDSRATEGTRACVQAVRARPFHPKPNASLDRGWIENGRNPDICPFETVCGPRYSSVLPQTDGGGHNRVVRWSWPQICPFIWG